MSLIFDSFGLASGQLQMSRKDQQCDKSITAELRKAGSDILGVITGKQQRNIQICTRAVAGLYPSPGQGEITSFALGGQ